MLGAPDHRRPQVRRLRHEGTGRPTSWCSVSADPKSRVHLRSVPDVPPLWPDDEHPGGGGDGTDLRPEVRLGADTYQNVVALDEALAANDPDVFQRALALVEVVAERKPGGSTVGAPVLRPLGKHSLETRISQRLRCVKWEEGAKEARKAGGAIRLANPIEMAGAWVPCRASSDAAVQPMLAFGRWQHIRPLLAVTESPVFRPDGTVMQVAGYDAATGYLYRPSCEYPTIPDQPTQADASRALDELRHVFCDFPYDGPASSLVPIGALLTIVARAAIDGPTPAFIFDASVRGSGKTLQGDVVHIIAFGRQAAHATWPEKPEDQEKLLACYAVGADPVAFFDNVKGILGGPSIESALTSSIVEFRVLGLTSKPRLPWVSVILVSGNNLTPTDDVVRRSLVARLEPAEENPENRTGFAHDDLPGWCMAERPRLIAAALTILRSYACHGYPAAGHGVMQSFQSWSRLIPGALAFAGGGNLLASRSKGAGASTDEIGAISVILRRLPELANDGEGLSTRHLIDAVYPAPGRHEPPDGWAEVREAIEDLAPARGGQPDAKKLGQAMGRFLGRWIDSRRLVPGSSKGVRKWRSESK